MRFPSLTASALALAALTATPGLANDPERVDATAGESNAGEASLLELVRAQQSAIRALEARISELEARTGAPTVSQAETSPPTLAASPPAHTTPVVAVVPPAAPAAPAPTASPNANTPTVFGRIHIDAWSASDNVGGTEVRRARMGVRGNIAENLSYLIDVDFAGNATSLQDVILDRRVGEDLVVRLGYHKIPFSFDDQTSDNYNLFMEHPAGLAPFTPGRAVGAAALYSRGDVFVHAGVFGEGESNARDGVVDENMTVGGRAVWAPGHSGDTMVHLGAAAYHTWVSDDAPTVRLRGRPERHLSPNVIDTGPLAADSLSALGLEAAINTGRFGAAAEAAWSSLDHASGDATFSGQSIEAWWTLTGEHRPYKMRGGSFNRLTPAHPISEGGLGAWQLAARLSTLDLTDGAVMAGQLDVTSLALNWYWTDHTRVMFDINRAEITPVTGPSSTDDGFGARLQVDW